MRVLRFTLLQSYFASIQKNKQKALFVINVGIFLSIFAFSTAVISFFIENKIANLQADLTYDQIDVRSNNKIISDIQNQINVLTEQLDKEDVLISEKRFVDEFDTLSKLTSTKDFYEPYIYFNLYNIENEIDEFREIGFNIFDKNDEFYSEYLFPLIEESWSKDDIKEFKLILEKLDTSINKALKIPLSNYSLNEPLSIEEISDQLEDNFNISLNNDTIRLNDYYDTKNVSYNIVDFMVLFLDIFRSFKIGADDTISNYEKEILRYSKLERNIILSTFILQFIIFSIIQIFEINSVNFNLKKKKRKKIK